MVFCMGMKLVSHWGKNTDWGCWGYYSDGRGMEWKEAGEDCM